MSFMFPVTAWADKKHANAGSYRNKIDNFELFYFGDNLKRRQS